MAGTPGFTTCGAALRRLLAVAALLGVVAMHGLAGHGTAHGDLGGPIAATAPAVHDHPAASMPMAGPSDTSPMLTDPSDPAQDGGLLGLVGMCLAALVIVVALVGTGAAVAHRVDIARMSAGLPFRARRDRDPPCLFALSVQRC